VTHHLNRLEVNKGWPSAANYMPPGRGRRLINIKSQPAALGMIIGDGIHQVIGDAIHETAYRAVDTLNLYYRNILWNIAKSKNHKAYAKRLDQDPVFGKALTRLVCGIYLLPIHWQ
jgi:hypothetical protein